MQLFLPSSSAWLPPPPHDLDGAGVIPGFPSWAPPAGTSLLHPPPIPRVSAAHGLRCALCAPPLIPLRHWYRLGQPGQTRPLSDGHASPPRTRGGALDPSKARRRERLLQKLGWNSVSTEIVSWPASPRPLFPPLHWLYLLPGLHKPRPVLWSSGDSWQ